MIYSQLFYNDRKYKLAFLSKQLNSFFVIMDYLVTFPNIFEIVSSLEGCTLEEQRDVIILLFSEGTKSSKIYPGC